MIRLPRSLRSWNTPEFQYELKRELEQVDPNALPLQDGLTISSHALDEEISVRIISVADDPKHILVKIGVFYSGVIAGCSCADDPTPIEPQNEYCEMLTAIDKSTAEASVQLLPD
jgi:hypothetical protein